jgi:hypothetical protein
MRWHIGVLTLVLGAGLLITPAVAQNSQQDRMKACNAEAGTKKLAGDARKTFMSDCLSGKVAEDTKPKTQQVKMKDCNATASDQKLTGDSRKAFMSSCLKK